MKKFVEPEINSVELSQMEAIMDSKNAGNSYSNYAEADSVIKDGFNTWKGFTE